MLAKINATNFLSWKSLDFSVNQGTTLIDGWNDDDQTAEGSGKSAVLNAISWCLYGKLPKEANIDDVIHHGEKHCQVSVTFNDGSIISRVRKPNDLSLTIRGKVVKGKDARETQKLIEEYTGLSFDAFCQSVYFAQNNDKSFLKSNQEARGKILSEIQDLSIFDKAKKEAASRAKKQEEIVVSTKHNLQLHRKDAESIETQIRYETQAKERLESEKEASIASMKTHINNMMTERDQVVYFLKETADKLSGTNVESKEAVQIEIDNLNQRLNSVTTELNDNYRKSQEHVRLKDQGERSAKAYQAAKDKVDKLKAFIENPTKNCPTCGTLLENCDTSHALTEVATLNSEMELHVKNMTAISEDMKQLELRDVTELQSEESTIKTLINNQKTKLRNIQEQERQILLHENDIKHKGQYKLDLDQKIEVAEKQLKEYENAPIVYNHEKLEYLQCHLETTNELVDFEVKQLQKEEKLLSQLNTLKSGFKEIKSYVFNSVLNEINSRISKYLEFLFETDVSLKFVNDNMKIGTMATLNGKPQGIGLFSGGQTRRLSLAVDLALTDVVSGRKGNKLGILILDEYFKDLSEQSMQKCLELLESRNQPVIMIEHNSIFKNIVDETFFVKYENGVSYTCH